MIPRLREHPRELEVLADRAAEFFRMPATYIEKDFWVTEVLRAASTERQIELLDGSSANVTFIFKGGTSLSRIFGIIERFSEDVDLLAIFPGGASSGSRDKILRLVDSDVQAHLGLSDDQVVVSSPTKGVKRYMTYQYPLREHNSSLKEGVVLELGSRGGTEPGSVHSMRSLVAEFAINQLDEPSNAWDEFESFEVNVLAPERTLFEKLAAVHDAATRCNRDWLEKHARHYYDISQLLQNERVLKALRELGLEGILELVTDIAEHSTSAQFQTTERPADGYAASPAFDIKNEAWSSIEIGYNAAQSLIYGDQVPLSSVLESVYQARELL